MRAKYTPPDKMTWQGYKNLNGSVWDGDGLIYDTNIYYIVYK